MRRRKSLLQLRQTGGEGMVLHGTSAADQVLQPEGGPREQNQQDTQHGDALLPPERHDEPDRHQQCHAQAEHGEDRLR